MVLLYSELLQLQRDLIEGTQILWNEGFHHHNKAGGHLAARIPGTDKFITLGHLHPRGKGMNGVKSVDDLIVMDTKMNKVYGKYEKSNEAIVHAAIFEARKDVGGTVYVHPPYCDYFAAAKKEIPTFGNHIPMLDTNGFVADPERASRLVEKLGAKGAIILRTPNSLVTCADTLRNAIVMAWDIEKTAMIDYHSLLIGMDAKEKAAHPRNPKYPPDDYSYYVEDFGVQVLHFDMWQYLWEKYFDVRSEGKGNTTISNLSSKDES